MTRPARVAATAFAALLVTSLCGEAMRARVDAAAFDAHQARWDCLVRETARIAVCHGPTSPRSEDADRCSDAVASCRASGAYADVERADARELSWARLDAVLRAAAFASTIALLAWLAIRWSTRRRSRAASN